MFKKQIFALPIGGLLLQYIFTVRSPKATINVLLSRKPFWSNFDVIPMEFYCNGLWTFTRSGRVEMRNQTIFDTLTKF